jgi:hypothetical protein
MNTGEDNPQDLLNSMAILKLVRNSKVHDHLAVLGMFSSDGFPTRQQS